MRPTFSLLTAVALLAVPLVAGAETLVEVGHNRLEPAAITIKSGDTVTFVNKDQTSVSRFATPHGVDLRRPRT